MSAFLKLTSRIINVSHIVSISYHTPSKYNVFLSTINIHGMLIIGSGGIESDASCLTICKKENPEDYQIIHNWIHNLELGYNANTPSLPSSCPTSGAKIVFE